MDRLNEILTTYKYPLLLGLVGTVLVLSGGVSQNLFQSPPKPPPKESLVSTNNNEQIKVDIAGAVIKPGLYSLDKEARIDDLLKIAGGIDPNVNTEFISKQLNRSQKLTDGQKIYIPFKQEPVSAAINTSTAVAGASTTNQKISLNTSSQQELEELPGVGPSTASKIISSRPYESVEDLLSKKIVGKATFEKIKAQIEL